MNQQTATEVDTANELIDDNETSMEHPAADGNAADGDTDDSNMKDGDTTMNGLWLMGQRLHRVDVLETFFVESGGEDYENLSLFNMPDLAERKDTGFSDGSGMVAGQEAEGSR